MSPIEMFLSFMVVVLVTLVARLLQQNKLLRAEVLRLEHLRNPTESHHKSRESDDGDSVENDGPSDDDEEAALVLKAKTACQIAEMSIDNLADEYERDRFARHLEKAESVALLISDPFYQGEALHEIIVLRASAGHEEKVRQLLEQIKDQFVRGRIEEELAELRSAQATWGHKQHKQHGVRSFIVASRSRRSASAPLPHRLPHHAPMHQCINATIEDLKTHVAASGAWR